MRNILYVVLLIFLCLVIYSVVCPNVHFTKHDSKESRQLCQGNLGSLYHFIGEYYKEKGKIPRDFDDLAVTFGVQLRYAQFLCFDDPSYQEYSQTGKNPGEVSYIWISDIFNKDKAEPFILIADKIGNHKNGRNVLFSNGNIVWMIEEEFQKVMNDKAK